MPAKSLKGMVKKSKTGKNLKDLERYWRFGKKAAKEAGLSGEKMYKYAMGIVKKRSSYAESAWNMFKEEEWKRLLESLKEHTFEKEIQNNLNQPTMNESFIINPNDQQSRETIIKWLNDNNYLWSPDLGLKLRVFADDVMKDELVRDNPTICKFENIVEARRGPDWKEIECPNCGKIESIGDPDSKCEFCGAEIVDEAKILNESTGKRGKVKIAHQFEEALLMAINIAKSTAGHGAFGQQYHRSYNTQMFEWLDAEVLPIHDYPTVLELSTGAKVIVDYSDVLHNRGWYGAVSIQYVMNEDLQIIERKKESLTEMTIKDPEILLMTAKFEKDVVRICKSKGIPVQISNEQASRDIVIGDWNSSDSLWIIGWTKREGGFYYEVKKGSPYTEPPLIKISGKDFEPTESTPLINNYNKFITSVLSIVKSF